MNILPSSASPFLYGKYPNKGEKEAKAPDFSKLSENSCNQDFVTISNQGKQMSDENLPVQAYALPKWFAQYAYVNVIELTPPWKDNYHSPKKPDSQIRQSTLQGRLYNNKLFRFLADELKAHGITNRSQYYYGVIQNDELSEKI